MTVRNIPSWARKDVSESTKLLEVAIVRQTSGRLTAAYV